jgi:hypothetical protein
MKTDTKIDISAFTEKQIKEVLTKCSIEEMLSDYKLTADFCVKYILSTDEYAAGVEDSYFDTNDVLLYQKHLTMEDLKNVYKKLKSKN